MKTNNNKPQIIVVDDYKPIPTRRRPIPTPRKSAKEMAKEYEDNIILPPSEFRDDYKSTSYKSVKQMAKEYEDNIILPPSEFRDDYKSTSYKSVKQMAKEYEDNIILPPSEFRDDYKPVPLPRSLKQIKKPVPTPAPAPRTIINQIKNALKGYTKSYQINIKNNKDPLVQLQNTRKGIETYIKGLLESMKGIKYIETLKVTLEKISGDEIISKTTYFNCDPQTIINHTEIADSLQLYKQQILNKIAQWTSEGSGWTISTINSHCINIVKYKPLNGSSYIQLPQELRNSAKGLINMKNKDNECFRWCHIRHLNPQDDPQRIKD